MQPSRTTLTTPPRVSNIVTREIISVALDTFRLYKVRFALTALGIMIGTASLIVVVTVGLTGREYILDQIRGIGANIIYISYSGDPLRGTDYLTVEDMRAIQQQVQGVAAAAAMNPVTQAVPVGAGKKVGPDVRVIGVDPSYRQIRNLDVLAGRFFDERDIQEHAKVADLAEHLAKSIFGTPQAAVGQTLRIGALPFTVLGVFKERVETFGQSELASGNVVVIPYPVSRYFMPGTAVDIFLSMSDPSQVEPATQQIEAILRSRHRPGSIYRVQNLKQLLTVATKAANALMVVLLLVAAITLVVGGVGIMNIMLATVAARTREIGIRKAVGATAAEIRLQFLAEAVLISLIGGVIGVALGVALPLSLRIFISLDIPISALSVFVALFVSSMVGVVFGTVPAARAAQMDPIESLHHQ